MGLMKAETEKEKVTFSNYAEFRKWTETQAGYWILVRGEPMPSPSPSRIHQELSKRIELALIQAVETKKLGRVYDAPLDVELAGDTVYQPDLLVVLNAHIERMQRTHIKGAPDLIVEVLSRSTAKLDLVDKRYDYAAAGVSEYWIIDPETQTVEIYALESGALSLKLTARESGTVTSIVLPHLSIDLTQLFADL